MANVLYDYQETIINHFKKKGFNYDQAIEYIEKLENQIGKTNLIMHYHINYLYLCKRKDKIKKIVNRINDNNIRHN
jgi:ABC-type tungstate transport system permease subunit